MNDYLTASDLDKFKAIRTEALSLDATIEVVETVGHDIVRQAPEAVLSAIQRMLSAHRTDPQQVIKPAAVEDAASPRP
jgi:hypothetical protein